MVTEEFVLMIERIKGVLIIVHASGNILVVCFDSTLTLTLIQAQMLLDVRSSHMIIVLLSRLLFCSFPFVKLSEVLLFLLALSLEGAKHWPY
jgi:hypothetical protein